MSHFVFGEFQTKQKIECSQEWIGDVLFSYDQGIDFFDGIFKMIRAHGKIPESERIVFCITSENQLKNSDDVLFPYDKFPDQMLVHEGTGRMDFVQRCQENLNILRNGLRDFIEKYRPARLRVFVSDGYDPEFECANTTLEGMLEDLEVQVIEDLFLEARVYEIELG